MGVILIAEDEVAIREFVVINLQRAGYEVVAVCDGQEAIDEFERRKGGGLDVIILDIMMPHKDGFEVCKYVRENDSTIGIIMLSAKSQEMDKVSGLMMGADDYMTKPFSPSELLARVDALCRRISVTDAKFAAEAENYLLKSGPFVMDLQRKALFKNEEPLDLTITEYSMMELFLKNKNVALSRTQILEEGLKKNKSTDEKLVDVSMRRLRMKIEDEPSTPKYISTVWGTGYRWEEQ
ncbi:DNA-binding response regulator [Clostridia bacterium]|nr:DNA-binding response regulator [Clostridia bacterium]